ncbi:SLAP domain-containing protein [Lactobacillus sp.]|uniref:SLAP domain-containing protein n=1 Tax=Lactobacillus sp. TaxID=1591 RepID=UPI003EF0DE08
MKFTKKLAFASASLALTLATPVSLAASNAVSFAATKTTTQATKIQVTKKNAPIYHKDGTKFTKKSPYVYDGFKSTTMAKGVSLNAIKTVTIKGAKYYYIGNSAYLKASDVKVTATKTVKTTTSTKTSSKSTSTAKKSTTAKTTTKKTKTVTQIKVAKKTVPFYHKDGTKYTKKNPYVYDGWKSAVAYKNTTYKVAKTIKVKGATYYYIGNNAYLKATDVKVTATK